MQAETRYRPLAEPDYDAVVARWARTEGVAVAEGDDRAGIDLA